MEAFDTLVATFIRNSRVCLPVEQIIDVKVNAIAEYFNQHSLSSVVVGVSGGVDSATVLALFVAVSRSGLLKQPLKIYAVNITYAMYGDVYDGKYYKDLKRAFTCDEVTWIKRDLSSVDQLLWSHTDLNVAPNPHDVQANVSYALRYTVLFSIAQQVGGITCGTTNFDEFGYIGWFGKNSDMVVDIQVLTDLHKFQVLDVAFTLGVPQSIIDRAPTGDLISGLTDEQAFGVTYDQLSWYTDVMTAGDPDFVPTEVRKLFAGVDKLHERNSHKYQGQTFNPVML